MHAGVGHMRLGDTHTARAWMASEQSREGCRRAAVAPCRAMSFAPAGRRIGADKASHIGK